MVGRGFLMIKKLSFIVSALLFSGVSYGATIDSFHNFNLSALTNAFGDVAVSDSVSLPLDQFDPTLGILNFVAIDVSTFIYQSDVKQLL
jgi:hypothetical protein